MRTISSPVNALNNNDEWLSAQLLGGAPITSDGRGLAASSSEQWNEWDNRDSGDRSDTLFYVR